MEIIDFVKRFVVVEKQAYDVLYSERDDEAVAIAQKEVTDLLADDVDIGLKPRPADADEKWLATGVQRIVSSFIRYRTVFQVKAYEHPDLGRLYRIYMSDIARPKTISKFDHNYKVNFFAVPKGDSFQIISYYRQVGHHKRESFPQFTDRRLIWGWYSGQVIETLGDVVQVWKFQEPSQGYIRAEYNADSTNTYYDIVLDSSADYDDLILGQLIDGRHQSKYTSPTAWLDGLCRAVPKSEKARFSDAVHRTLLNDSAEVRAGALSILEDYPKLRQYDKLIDIVENNFDLFRGVPYGSAEDMGETLLTIACDCTIPKDSRPRHIRRHMILHDAYAEPLIGIAVVRDLPWVLDNFDTIYSAENDPNGVCMDNSLLWLSSNRRRTTSKKFVVKINTVPAFRPNLKHAIEENVKDPWTREYLRNFVTEPT